MRYSVIPQTVLALRGSGVFKGGSRYSSFRRPPGHAKSLKNLQFLRSFFFAKKWLFYHNFQHFFFRIFETLIRIESKWDNIRPTDPAKKALDSQESSESIRATYIAETRIEGVRIEW